MPGDLASATPPKPWTPWQMIKDSYLLFDRRTLGITRILLGFYLIMDLFRRTPDWFAMFGDIGVLPTWTILNRPQASNFSLVHGFSTAPELVALWLVIFCSYVLLLVGYRTKIWQVLALLFVTSMNGRVLLIENGGYVVQNLLLLWTAFLPLGDRFSIDSMRSSLARKRESSFEELQDRSELAEPFRLLPHYSLAGLAISLQLSAVYYFNVVHKTGANWHNGTAVHYVLYNDRMATPIVAAIREHVPFWLIKGMTPSVLAAEAILPFCLLLPAISIGKFQVKPWLRRIAIVLILALHIGFGSSFVLGPFAWALCIFSTLLFLDYDWRQAISAMRKPARRRTVLIDPKSPALWWLARVLVRMDRFELLGFAPASGPSELASGLLVLRPNGEIVTGHQAVAEIVAALPAGPPIAALLKLPVVNLLLDLVLENLRGRTSLFFGLSVAGPRTTRLLAPSSRLAFHTRKGRAAFREVLCALMLVAAFNQALTELWSTRQGWAEFIKTLNATGPVQSSGLTLKAQPEPLRILSHKLRFLQGWFMFSPNPVMDDGTIVVAAQTADGRTVDPFWGVEPNFDLLNTKSFRYNQIWSDYFNRMHMGQNRAYRDAMVDYMRRLPERTGDPQDRLVSGEVYWVTDMNPKWGTRSSYNERRELLFTFTEEGGAHNPPAPPKMASK